MILFKGSLKISLLIDTGVYVTTRYRHASATSIGYSP